jgi:hypothetical protein
MAGVKAEAGDLGAKPVVGIEGAEAKAEAGTVGLSARTSIGVAAGISTAVGVGTRAPFSPSGIAEHLAADPEFYRRMATMIASELTLEIAKLTGHGNAEQVIKNELVTLQTGFTEIAKQIGLKAYEVAANTVVALRDNVVAFHDSYPDPRGRFWKDRRCLSIDLVLGHAGRPSRVGCSSVRSSCEQRKDRRRHQSLEGKVARLRR